MPGPYLVVGIGGSDWVDLADGSTTFYPASMLAAGGGISMPGGISFSPHPRGVFAQAGQQPSNTTSITMTVICTSPQVGGSATNAVEGTWRSINNKLEQARRASSDMPVGTPVYFAHHVSGAAEQTSYLIVDGTLAPVAYPVPDGSPYKFGVLTLFVRPYGTGAQLADAVSATLTNGNPNTALRRANVPGDVEALAKWLVTDVSTGGVIIQRMRGFVRTARPLPANDFTPIYAFAAVSPGTTFGDATAYGGSCARLAASSAWQTFATVPSAAGAHQNGRYDAWAVVRDNVSPLSPPTWPQTSAAVPSGTGGALLDGQYLAVMTSRDGSSNESNPLGAQLVTVPTTQTTFYDGAESQDFALWDGTAFRFANNGTVGDISVTTAASYPLDAPGNAYGFRALSGTGTHTGFTDSATALAYKAIPGGTTGAIRFRMRVNTNSGAGTNTIPLVLDGSNNAQIILSSAGGGWSFLVGATSAEAGFGQGDWLASIECRITAYNAITKSCTASLLVNDVVTQTLTGTLAADPARFAIGAISVATSGDNLSLSVDFDDVQMSAANIGANTGSIVYTWALPATGGGTGSALYVQRNGGTWQRIAVTGTTYTLTSNTAGAVSTGPPLGAPALQFGQFRLQYGVKGSAALYQYSQPVSVTLGNAWQLVRFPGIVLPPQAPQFGQPPAPWVVNLQGIAGGTATPNMDGALLLLAPSDESGFVATAPGATLATLGQWQIDMDPSGHVSAEIYDAATGTSRIQAATISGQLTYGPGDTIAALICEVSDGSGHFVVDMVNAKYTVQTLLSPRYETPAGVR